MEVEKILHKYWGFTSFRPLQKEIIQTVLERKDTLALLPTGGGKSLCFQVPALKMGGLCIVVTPLIALMKDQVENLKRRGISAVAVHSGMSFREIDIALNNCVYGGVKFLYLSPERLKTEIFQVRVHDMNVSLLAIDEAHCISQWGYDFRPAYLEVAKVREYLPNVPIIALTATATPKVQEDIQEKLLFREGSRQFQKSFLRENLSYSAFYEEDKARRTLEILRKVQGTAIVYVKTRSYTSRFSDYLNQIGISSDFYHGGLSFEERNHKQQRWIDEEVRVMVCTNAFGMGIDKPNVRLVVHHGMPNSLEAYYQEAGRAGRDGYKSYAVLLYENADIEYLEEALQKKYPTVDFLRRVYQALANYLQLAIGSNSLQSYDLELKYFSETYRLQMVETYHALKVLELEGYIQLTESHRQVSKLRFLVENRELYNFQVQNATYDFFIKSLLRSYGAELFTDYMVISERAIAERLGMPEKIVEKYLKYLHKTEIVDYIGKTEVPQITFLTPRQDAKRLAVSAKKLDEMKAKEEEKLNAIKAFVQSTHLCRTVQFCNYFGETLKEPCGVCDHCIAERKQVKNQGKNIESKIIQSIQSKQGIISVEELIKQLPNYSSKEIVQTCRILLDKQLIIKREDGKYQLS